MKKEQLLNNLGKRIREIRKTKKITQVELANSIGKDQQSIQRLEAGNINPSFYYLFEVAKGLDVEIEELLKFESHRKL
jgi:putative transcriptional regulator